MINRVEQITIVGGGTAGWLTAMILGTFLNRSDEGPPVRITLIESPKVPTVGVGEATLASLQFLMKQLAIDEAEFFRRTNASFKLSVRFGDWAVDPAGQGISFFHPFNTPPYLAGIQPIYHYKRFGAAEGSLDLADAMVVNSALIRANRGPRNLGAANYERAIAYAYHVDAALLGEFLRDVAVSRGIRHIRDDIVEVVQEEDGSVSALRLEQGGLHPVELVVDCTGFRGLIVQQALSEPFVPFSDQLLCDRAIPVQLPHAQPARLEPCTRATALDAGWVWRVPLFSRVGTGYVYSSAFRSDEEAHDEFLRHVRAVGDLPAEAHDPDLNVIRMKIGRIRRPWVKNCVAIGLAGGFLEPLESTAIAMTETSARWLAGLLPDRQMSPEIADRFNAKVERLYDEVRDFIVTQYYTSNRPEPFWQAARKDIKLSDKLRENLALWRRILPDEGDTPGYRIFDHWNYIYTLWPKGYFQDRAYPLEGSVSHHSWQGYSRQLAQKKARLVDSLPEHAELIRAIRGEIEHPEASQSHSLPSGYRTRAAQRPTVPLPGT